MNGTVDGAHGFPTPLSLDSSFPEAIDPICYRRPVLYDRNIRTVSSSDTHHIIIIILFIVRYGSLTGPCRLSIHTYSGENKTLQNLKVKPRNPIGVSTFVPTG